LSKRAFVVKQIKCRINNGVCSREIEGILWHLSDSNYFSIDRKELHWAISQMFPVEKLAYNFSYPNTLEVNIDGAQDAYSIQSFQTVLLPPLSLDLFGASTESAQWRRPIPEIENFVDELEGGTSQKMWENGILTSDTSTATVSGQITHIFTSIPSSDQVRNMYKIISLSNRYLDKPKIYIMDDRIFLSAGDLPDIMINVDSPLENVEMSLQSMNFLVTIKKDARVFNLSFKHPIIK